MNKIAKRIILFNLINNNNNEKKSLPLMAHWNNDSGCRV